MHTVQQFKKFLIKKKASPKGTIHYLGQNRDTQPHVGSTMNILNQTQESMILGVARKHLCFCLGSWLTRADKSIQFLGFVSIHSVKGSYNPTPDFHMMWSWEPNDDFSAEKSMSSWKVGGGFYDKGLLCQEILSVNKRRGLKWWTIWRRPSGHTFPLLAE